LVAVALGELAELHLRELARAFHRDRAETPKLDPARPPVNISILEDEGLQTRVNGANAEALQLSVPEERLAGLVARQLQAFDSRLRQPPAHGPFAASGSGDVTATSPAMWRM
jgi:hypothetical protein